MKGIFSPLTMRVGVLTLAQARASKARFGAAGKFSMLGGGGDVAARVSWRTEDCPKPSSACPATSVALTTIPMLAR